MSTPRIHRQSVGGATLLTLPDASLPLVRFVIALRRAALADPLGKSGRGRLFLELMQRGTQTKPREVWSSALERLGSQVGAAMGSELGYVRGAALKRHFAATLELVGEALVRPALLPEARQDLIDETLEQLHAERDHDDAVAEIFLRRALYGSHLLARSPSGEASELARLDDADMRTAQGEHLAAADLVIACAGDITPEDAARLFAPLLAMLPSARPPPLAIAPLPEPAGLTLWIVDKPERSQVQLRLGRLSLSGTHADTDAFWLGATAFGGTFTSPFTHEVRDVRGWSYTAHSEFTRRRLTRSPFVLRSAPAVQDALPCLALELELYRGLARGELADEPLELARAYLQNRYPFEVATAADLLLPAVRNEVLGLPLEELFTTPERLAALSAESVRTALSAHLHPQNVVGVLVATAKDVEAGVRERFPDARIQVISYLDGIPTEDFKERP